MRLFVAKVNDRLSIVMGTITEVVPGKDEYADRVQNVKIKGNVWNKEKNEQEEREISVAFWNTEKNSLRDKAVAAKLEPGKNISILVSYRKGRYYAVDFKYVGIWKIAPTEEHKERNIIIGNVWHFNAYDNRVTFQIQVKKGKDKKEYENITIWNSETMKNADNAKKLLEDNKNVCLVCGPNRPFTAKNGEEKNSYVAYQFDVL